jgi:hypothetical protein
MRFSTSAVLVTMLGWIGAATAHNIQLKAHSRECFHEKLHKDDKMTVTFQVGDREFGGSGNLEIDFWVRCVYPWLSKFSKLIFFLRIHRLKTLPETANILRTVSHQKTTPSPHSEMENSPTALVTRPGHRTPKKYLSMCMELSTSLSRSWHKIL